MPIELTHEDFVQEMIELARILDAQPVPRHGRMVRGSSPDQLRMLRALAHGIYGPVAKRKSVRGRKQAVVLALSKRFNRRA